MQLRENANSDKGELTPSPLLKLQQDVFGSKSNKRSPCDGQKSGMLLASSALLPRILASTFENLSAFK